MLSGLLLLIIVLAFNSLSLENASEGIKFYLLPDWERAKETGLLTVVTAAMSQAFFTLSIGIASIEILGSYMSDEHTLLSESVKICALDTAYLGTYNFPRLLQLRGKARSGTVAYFHHPAESLCKYARRQDMGCAVLFVYDICKLFHGHGGVRKPCCKPYG